MVAALFEGLPPVSKTEGTGLRFWVLLMYRFKRNLFQLFVQPEFVEKLVLLGFGVNLSNFDLDKNHETSMC